MKFQLVACLALLAVANGLPTQPLHSFFGQPSTATGGSNAGITGGNQVGPAGTSVITQSNVETGGQTTGAGTNVGTAAAEQGSRFGPFGNQEFANVDTTSIQNTKGQFPGFPGLSNLGTATGGASSGFTQGKTQGIGGSSTVMNLSSSAKGSATNGGSSFNAASGSSQNTDGIFGSSQQSSNKATSAQTGR